MDSKASAELRPFPSHTRWSLVFRAGEGNSEEQRQALDELLRLYRPALLLHVVKAFNLGKDDAEDLVQGFIADKIIHKDLVSRAKPRGSWRFRDYLRTSLTNYVRGQFRKDNAEKRRPKNAKVLQTDDYERVAVWEDLGARLFDVAWVREEIAEVLKQVEAHYRKTCQEKTWAAFEYRLLRPILEQRPPPPYVEFTERFGFESPEAAYNTVMTARRLFASIVRNVVAAYTPDEEIEDEIRSLIEILSHADA